MDLERYIRERSSVNGDIVNVDTFLNHKVDAALMGVIGRRIAGIAAPLRPDVLVTAEASGIAPALSAASELRIPMIYAKKYVLPGPREAVSREVASATKGFEYTIEIRRRVLDAGLRALVVDDFLARGRTAVALGEIVEDIGCRMLGAVFVIEKGWVGGRHLLEDRGWPVWSVVNIASVEGGVIQFG
ncbi:MAG: phosphoribosyltransferase family protein [bacterium]|nr:phosphoribosyltransferase family protein [bacterium]